MFNRIRAGQAAAYLNSQHDICIQDKDIYHIVQTNLENLRSLSDIELTSNESQRLLQEITHIDDQYRIKFRDNI